MAKNFALKVDVKANVGNFKKGLKNAKGATSGFKGSITGLNKSVTNSVAKIGLMTAGIVGMARAVRGAVRSIKSYITAADKQLKAEAAIVQAVEQTGYAAGFTASQLKNMASELQSLTLYGDEDILTGVTSQLLTFTKITGDVFKRAQMAVLDVATVMKTDAKSGALQLGKALNDPILGMTAMSRSGIQFTQVQKEMVKSMVEMGNVAGAQTLILDELNLQFGGQAKKAAETGIGSWTQAMNTLGDVWKENIGNLMIPLVIQLAKAIKDNAGKIEVSINNMITNIINFINSLIDLYNQFLKSEKEIKSLFVLAKIHSFFIKFSNTINELAIKFVFLKKVISGEIGFGDVGIEWKKVNALIISEDVKTSLKLIGIWTDYIDKVNEIRSVKPLKHISFTGASISGGAAADGAADAAAAPSVPDIIPTLLPDVVIDQMATYTNLYQQMSNDVIAIESDTQEQIKGIKDYYNQIERDENLAKTQEFLGLTSNLVGGVGSLWASQKEKELSMVGDNAKKREAIELKYARREKAIALVQAAINGALAITKAMSQTGVLSPFVIPMIIAGTAIQMAAIASQKFAEGGAVSGPQLAMVGEAPNISRSNPEFIGTAKQLGLNGIGGEVVFKIEGDTLVGILANKNRRNNSYQ